MKLDEEETDNAAIKAMRQKTFVKKSKHSKEEIFLGNFSGLRYQYDLVKQYASVQEVNRNAAPCCRFFVMTTLVLIILLWAGLTTKGKLTYYAFDHYTRIIKSESYPLVTDTDSFFIWLKEASRELIFQGYSVDEIESNPDIVFSSATSPESQLCVITYRAKKLDCPRNNAQTKDIEFCTNWFFSTDQYDDTTISEPDPTTIPEDLRDRNSDWLTGVREFKSQDIFVSKSNDLF